MLVQVEYDDMFPDLNEEGFITVMLDDHTGTVGKSGKVVMLFS